MRRIPSLLSLLLSCALPLSCGGDDEHSATPAAAADASPEVGPPAITGDFQLIAPAASVVRTGGSASFDLTLTRSGGFAPDVQVEVVDLGDGVAADIAQPGEGTSARVTLSASASATTGERALKVRASAGGIAREATVALMVAGKPGEVDTAFGTAGLVPKTGGSDIPTAIVTAPDGRLYVLLLSSSPTLVRYTVDGQLDTSFGTAGKKTFVVGTNAMNAGGGWHLVALPDGSLLVAGIGSERACITKLDATGLKVTAFGTNGDACVPSATLDVFDRIKVLADGSIVAVGARNASSLDSSRDLFLAKLSADGKLDSEFGAKGIVDLARTGVQYARDLAVDSKGRIVVRAECGGIDSACIWRVISAGYTDLAFDDDGVATLPKPESSIYGQSVFVGPSDAAIAIGSIGLGALDASGKPLAGFGTGGWAPLKIGQQSLTRALDVDGKILAVGTDYTGPMGTKTLVARIDPAMRSFDAGFGDGGVKVLPLDAEALDLTLQPYRAVVLGWYGPIGAYSLIRIWR